MIDERHGNDEQKKIKKMIAKQGAFAGTEIVHPSTPEKTVDRNEVAKMVEKHRNAGGKIIYEVGFGGKFCANLNSYDLSVGIDPMFSNKLDTNGLEDKMYAERLFFNQATSELPDGVYPDYIIMVAPSPESVDMILDELESKIGRNTKIAIFIENQSRQAVDGRASDMLADAKDRFSLKGKSVKSYPDAANLEDDFSDYLQSIGLSAGGELKTSPWEGAGDWMVVTAI